MRVVLSREIPEDADLRRQWNALAHRVERPQVFYTWEWAWAVQRAYRETMHPLLFLGYEGESLIGVAALAADPAGHVSFLCANTADYCDFITSPEQREPFVGAVLTELRKHELKHVTLTNLPADSATVAALRRVCAEYGYRIFSRLAYECAQVSLGELRLPSGEPKSELPMKKKLRRSFNALGRETPLQLKHAESWDAAQSLLPRFIHAHVARFLTTGRISNLARPERQLFLEELARLLSDGGWLKLTRLMSGDKVLAWNYGFDFDGTWFWYQPTFDCEYVKLSPGICLLGKIVEQAGSVPSMKMVDLGLGDEEYKNTFANRTQKTLYVTLRASLVQHTREILRYDTARAIKTFPKLEAHVRTAAERLRHMRENGYLELLTRAGKWLRGILWSSVEVLFFDGCAVEERTLVGATLESLNLNHLASALMQYVDDRETCAYLLRSAARLRQDGPKGFALLDADGSFLHFAWITEFEGFYLAELRAKVEAPSPDCVLLFDCWTPVKMRGHGYYGRAVSRIAKLMREEGKQPWIFSAANNLTSVHGLEKTGFRQRYSLARKRVFGVRWLEGATPKSNEKVATEISASA